MKNYKKQICGVLLCGILLNFLPNNVQNVSANENETYVEGEVLVLYDEGKVSVEQCGLEIQTVESIAESKEQSIALVKLSEEETVEEAVKELTAAEGVIAATPNYIIELEATSTPSDPYMVYQDYLDTIYAKQCWNILKEVPHEKVKVAVLDTGADYTHSDLKNIVNVNQSAEILTTSGITGPLLGDDYSNGYKNQETSHGTHVCGIIAAEAGNMEGIAGVASATDNSVVDLIAVDVFCEASKTTISHVIQGMEYAMNQGAKVINLSLGVKKQVVQNDAILKAECQKLADRNITLVCAAGNDGLYDYGTVQMVPSDYDSTISVMAADYAGYRADFSNYGSKKTVVAPGLNIYSTISGGRYAYKSGTSMATPVVTALVAMLYSVDPDITYPEVKRIVTETANPLADADFCGAGMIDGEEMLNMVLDDGYLPYYDISPYDWFYPGVLYMYQNKIMTGLNPVQFGTAYTMSRAEFATVIYRMEGSPDTNYYGEFRDVSGNDWYAKAAAWCRQNGIITGYGNGNFGGNDRVLREQVATILMRYENYKGQNTAVNTEGILAYFPDQEDVSAYARDGVAWMIQKGIVKGINGYIKPLNNTYRTEIATMLQRYLEQTY